MLTDAATPMPSSNRAAGARAVALGALLGGAAVGVFHLSQVHDAHEAPAPAANVVAEKVSARRHATPPHVPLGPTSAPEQYAVMAKYMLPPRQVFRAPSEWQGMIVDNAVTPYCAQSEACGLARACINYHCVGCARDDECASDELCVLENCLKQANVGCRSSADCDDGLCIMTPYSSDARGNTSVTSYCSAGNGPAKDSEEKGWPAGEEPPAVATPFDELLSALATSE